MSRAILPGARVRTSNQKARVGIRHARGEVPEDQTQPDPEPDTVTTTPDETQAEPQPCTESNAAVRLVRVDADQSYCGIAFRTRLRLGLRFVRSRRHRVRFRVRLCLILRHFAACVPDADTGLLVARTDSCAGQNRTTHRVRACSGFQVDDTANGRVSGVVLLVGCRFSVCCGRAVGAVRLLLTRFLFPLGLAVLQQPPGPVRCWSNAARVRDHADYLPPSSGPALARVGCVSVEVVVCSGPVDVCPGLTCFWLRCCLAWMASHSRQRTLTSPTEQNTAAARRLRPRIRSGGSQRTVPTRTEIAKPKIAARIGIGRLADRLMSLPSLVDRLPWPLMPPQRPIPPAATVARFRRASPPRRTEGRAVRALSRPPDPTADPAGFPSTL